MTERGLSSKAWPADDTDFKTAFNISSTLNLTDNDILSSKNEKSEVDIYIPSEYREPENSTPDWGALAHLLKSSLGSGILAMPGAFKNAGVIFGIVGTIVTGIICTYCVHLLVYCSQKLCVRLKTPALGFAETAEEAFRTGPIKYRNWAPFAREFVNMSLLTTHYLGNTCYLILIADSFQQVIEYYYATNINIRYYLLLLAIPLVPLGLIRTLKVLVPFSVIATIFILTGLCFTVYYTITGLPSLDERPYIRSPEKWPLFFSTVLFAMEGIGTVLPIENSMENPHHFSGCPGVLNIAMTLVVTLYSSVGLVGYLKFGDDALGSITLNLGETPLAQIVKIMVALSILFTYGLQFTVPSEILWKKIAHRFNEKNEDLAFYIMKAVMILGTVILAILVPQLSPCISLVGAVCFSMLGLFCPAAIDTITIYEEGYGFMKWKLIKNFTLMFLAIFAVISGSYASILEIIASYSV